MGELTRGRRGAGQQHARGRPHAAVAPEQLEDVLRVEGLLQELVGAELRRHLRPARHDGAGHQHGQRAHALGPGEGQRLRAGEAGQAHVDEGELDPARGQRFQGRVPGLGLHHLRERVEGGDGRGEALADVRRVVGDQRVERAELGERGKVGCVRHAGPINDSAAP